MLVLQSFQSSQRIVPIGLERIGHEAMLGIALEKAPALQLRLVACALALLLAQAVGLLYAAGDLVLDRQRDLDRGGCDGAQQQLADCGVDIATANRLTGLSRTTHALFGA